MGSPVKIPPVVRFTDRTLDLQRGRIEPFKAFGSSATPTVPDVDCSPRKALKTEY